MVNIIITSRACQDDLKHAESNCSGEIPEVGETERERERQTDRQTDWGGKRERNMTIIMRAYVCALI